MSETNNYILRLRLRLLHSGLKIWNWYWYFWNQSQILRLIPRLLVGGLKSWDQHWDHPGISLSLETKVSLISGKEAEQLCPLHWIFYYLHLHRLKPRVIFLTNHPTNGKERKMRKGTNGNNHYKMPTIMPTIRCQLSFMEHIMSSWGINFLPDHILLNHAYF